jgi:hypothetical protein
MIYQIIGWLFTLVSTAYMSMVWFAAIMNNCGKYNIGGCRNSLLKKSLTMLCLVPIVMAWFGVYFSAPFSLVMK